MSTPLTLTKTHGKMPERIVVDAEGHRIKERMRRRQLMKTFPARLRVVPQPDNPTLDKLEDAIWNQGNGFITDYLELVTRDCMEFEEYLKILEKRRRKALQHCWVKLKWRPSKCGNRVIVNPYL